MLEPLNIKCFFLYLTTSEECFIYVLQKTLNTTIIQKRYKHDVYQMKIQYTYPVDIVAFNEKNLSKVFYFFKGVKLFLCHSGSEESVFLNTQLSASAFLHGTSLSQQFIFPKSNAGSIKIDLSLFWMGLAFPEQYEHIKCFSQDLFLNVCNYWVI